MNNSRFKLGIIELFFPIRHNESYTTNNHEKNGYYTLSLNIGLFSFYNKVLIDLIINTYNLFYKESYINNGLCYHYFHPNFENIVKNEKYFDVKIIEILQMNNKEIIIDKTFYLRLLQKKFRKYYYKKLLEEE